MFHVEQSSQVWAMFHVEQMHHFAALRFPRPLVYIHQEHALVDP
jgi:hypothetical protein